MRQVLGSRPLIAVSAAVLTALGTATAAQAAAVTVTGDDGNPVALAPNAPLGIRNMSPSIGVGFLPTEDASYSVAFAAPDGVAAANAANCFTTKVPINRALSYRGNGAYTITVSNFAKTDRNCATPTSTETYTVVIGGAVAIAAPTKRHLIRSRNSYTTRTLSLPFGGNPGATLNEIVYARGGVIGPDGGISGPVRPAFVNPTTGQVEFRVSEAGTYTMVARASAYGGGARFFTPWSPPVTIQAISPFDLASLRFPDSRGPSYQLRGTLRDTTIRGRVSIQMARGKKGGKYRSIGRAKISSKGTFTKRFTQRRTGDYRVRVKYSGSKTAQAGTIVHRIRISRRFAL
jgi:hypothetical protein